MHRLRLAFEPAVGGSVVEVRLGNHWFPQIRVDDCYAYFPDPEFDEESDDDVESADEAFGRGGGDPAVDTPLRRPRTTAGLADHRSPGQAPGLLSASGDLSLEGLGRWTEPVGTPPPS